MKTWLPRYNSCGFLGFRLVVDGCLQLFGDGGFGVLGVGCVC